MQIGMQIGDCPIRNLGKRSEPVPQLRHVLVAHAGANLFLQSFYRRDEM